MWAKHWNEKKKKQPQNIRVCCVNQWRKSNQLNMLVLFYMTLLELSWHCSGFCICDHLTTKQTVTLQLQIRVLAEEGCGKMQVNGWIRQKDKGNEQQKTAKQRELGRGGGLWHRRGEYRVQLPTFPKQKMNLFHSARILCGQLAWSDPPFSMLLMFCFGSLKTNFWLSFFLKFASLVFVYFVESLDWLCGKSSGQPIPWNRKSWVLVCRSSSVTSSRDVPRSK